MPARIWTKDDIAHIIIDTGHAMGITERGIVIGLSVGIVESNLTVYANAKVPGSLELPHDAVGSDGLSVGVQQQQVVKTANGYWWGPVEVCQNPEGSTRLFYSRLTKRDYNGPNSPGSYAQAVQGSAFPDRYDQKMDEAQRIYDRLTKGGGMPAVGWTGDPTWLKQVLQAVPGLNLKTLDGWEDSGHGDFKDIRGVMVHHTGNSRETAQSIRNGRSDLEGPLSNLHISPDGTVTIVAAGVCWHAGAGSYPWLPTDMANWHMIGIECAWPDIAADGSYDADQRWPDAQIIAMRDTCAALALRLGHPATRVIGHKEWAGSAQGKWDPGNCDMSWFRGEVAKAMRGEFTPPTEPSPQPGPILPPIDYGKEVWDQLRHEWPQLGGQTLVNAVGEVRDKVCGTTDYADWKAGK